MGLPQEMRYTCFDFLEGTEQDREYWIVDPAEKVVESYYLEDGRYFASASGGDEKLKVRVLDDCVIDLDEVFAQLSNEPEETT